ncbi:YcxB family protein [Ferruginibacter sp.]
MLIKSQLTEKDFIKINLVLLYSKISIKIFTVLIFIFLLITIVTVILIPSVSFTQLIVPVVMLLFLPLFTYFVAKRNFNISNRISELIEYNFDNENLTMKGESFNSQLSLDKIAKVAITKNWLLIWQNRQFANPIPKRDISALQLTELKEILDSKKVKNNL